MSAHLSTKNDYESLIEKYDTWMFDCDGVLWHGDRPVEGAVEVLDTLRKRGKRLLFVTNNATKSRRSYKSKFDQLGVQATVVRHHFHSNGHIEPEYTDLRTRPRCMSHR